MKTFFSCAVLLCFLSAAAQNENAENVFVITADGFRWQEIFNGADSLLINDPDYVKDTALTRQMYWDPSPAERRKKLLPFFWNVLSKQGQLYGNRNLESKVSVKNPYKISYPGYNEMLTGYADPLPILNAPQYNRNVSVLEYLNNLAKYNGRVAAFSSWNVFPFILNNKRNTMLQNSGYASMSRDGNESIEAVNEVQEKLEDKYKTRYDVLTFFNAKEYVKGHHPKVVFIGLGETDEAAHLGRYDLYLQQAAAFDKMLSELWYLVQTDSVYKNKTTFIISTDHGRGRKNKWVSHHTLIKGSGQIWLALLGKGIEPQGEMHDTERIVQDQVAATVGYLLGEKFISRRTIGKPVHLPPSEVRLAAGASDSGTQAEPSSFTINK